MARFVYVLRPVLLSALLGLIALIPAEAQQRWIQYQFSRNVEVAKVQPTWAVPVIAPYPGLVQYYRFAATRSVTPEGTITWNYGSGRGGGLIEGNRWQFDVCLPPYLQHNMRGTEDGFADTSISAKYRIASSPNTKRNYIVTALLVHTFATGSAKNGARTDSFTPTLEAGKGWGRYNVQTTLGGTLPTGKIAEQGRTINWNATVQDKLAGKLFGAIENNATYYVGGPHGGKVQNFITPELIVPRLAPKGWLEQKRALILAAGFQIATSSYHGSNHNLILDARFLF